MKKFKFLSYPMLFVLGILLLSSCKKDSPELTLTNIVNIKQESAEIVYIFNYPSSNTIQEFGMCWSVNPNPRKSDNYQAINTSIPEAPTITGLSLNTQYHVALYGKFSSGEYYSNDMSFTTLGVPFVSHNGNNLYYYNGTLSVESATWGPDGVTGANSQTDGAFNTAQIDNVPGFFAAKVCSQLNAYGYSDWYMPSVDEFTSFYIAGGILSNQNSYWSSTEFNSTEAYQFNGSSGSINTLPKLYSGSCFCVRKD